MADTLSCRERSKNMAKIRNRDTKPEIFLRKKLFSLGYRYRKNTSMILGHPDIWLSKYKTAIFVNGCFWHRHEGCKYSYMPKSRIDFWEAKFEKNKLRDDFVKREVLNLGYKYIVIWECTVKKMMRSDEYSEEVLDRITCFLSSIKTQELII